MLMLPSLHFPVRFASRASLTRIAAVCAALALTACASKNPLLEDTASTDAAASSAAKINPELSTKTTELTQTQRFLWFFSPYRITVQQGNFISQEMLAQVKTGMTKDQVRFLLGTALLNDVFHGERWDYPFRLQKGNGETTTSRITVYFKDNKVERIDAGQLPTEKDYLIRIAGPTPEAQAK